MRARSRSLWSATLVIGTDDDFDDVALDVDPSRFRTESVSVPLVVTRSMPSSAVPRTELQSHVAGPDRFAFELVSSDLDHAPVASYHRPFERADPNPTATARPRSKID